MNKKVPERERKQDPCVVQQGCPGHLLALSKNLGSSVAGNVPPSLRKSPRRGGARWVVAAPGRAVSSEASGRRGKQSSSAHALAVQGSTVPGVSRHVTQCRAPPRWGVGAPRPAGQASGRTVTARPSLASPPPGFLRRPRPPCCCGAEAAPAEPSGRDRLRNRFAAADLTTDPAAVVAAAAARQGLPRQGCRGTRGGSVAR